MGDRASFTKESVGNIAKAVRESGHPGYEHKTFLPKYLAEAVTIVSQLNISNSKRITRLALEDIARRSFVAEATYKNMQDKIQLSVNGSEVIRVIRLSDMSVLVAWLSTTTNKINLVVLTRGQNNEWQQGTLKVLSLDNVFHFDMTLMSNGVVCLFSTSRDISEPQKVMRLDIQNTTITEHGAPVVVRVHMCKYVKVSKLTDTRLLVISWGYSGGARSGYTNIFVLEMDPYDVNPNGNAQGFVHREGAIVNSNNEFTWSFEAQGGVSLCALSHDSFWLTRICLNNNVVAEHIRILNGSIVKNRVNEGAINGVRRISSVILSPSKLCICVCAANKVLGLIINLNSLTRSNPVELLQGQFEELNVCKLSNNEIVVGAYGSGESSNKSVMVKFKVDVDTNEFTKDIEAEQTWLGLGVNEFMDAINLLVVANEYTPNTQASRLICLPMSFNKGVRIAQADDKIIGISETAAMESNNVPIIVPDFFADA